MDRFAIELTPEEQALADQIEFHVLALDGFESVRRNAQLARELTERLFGRDAVPEHRRRHFTDPTYNVSGRGRSRQQQFERHGRHGGAIAEHPHFLPYLHYFLFGADLPQSMRSSFQAAVEECGGVTSGDIPVLSRHARSLARRSGLPGYRAREEFYKLALDCGLGPSNATSIRDAVRTGR